MNYMKKRGGMICILICIIFVYNVYFFLLLKAQGIEELLYVDVLVFVILSIITILDLMKYHKEIHREKELLESEQLIYMYFDDRINNEILEHDLTILQEQNNEQYAMNCDLQDYMTKWVHEIKIPLSIGLLINDKISDTNLRSEQRTQLERMNQLLNAALVCCKVQSKLYDLQIKRVNLSDCIRNSIRNNQYFLIRNHFQMDIQYEDVYVYSDSQWLVYVLDQLISNAIKYVGKEAILKIYMQHNDNIQLFVEDHGEGIKEKDIKRIFDKGFTGDNYHNGKYKSTGMGLYMVGQILNKLTHGICVESKYGKFTRFTITFHDNHQHFIF